MPYIRYEGIMWKKVLSTLSTWFHRVWPEAFLSSSLPRAARDLGVLRFSRICRSLARHSVRLETERSRGKQSGRRTLKILLRIVCHFTSDGDDDRRGNVESRGERLALAMANGYGGDGGGGGVCLTRFRLTDERCRDGEE